MRIHGAGRHAKKYSKNNYKKGLFSQGGYGVIIFRVEGISAVIV